MPKVKQVLVVRRDLWLRTGTQIRLAVQAAVRAILEEAQMEVVSEWLETGAKTEVYAANSRVDLELLYTTIRDAGKQPAWIVNSDHDKVHGPIPAAMAIGPGSAEDIDRLVDGLSNY